MKTERLDIAVIGSGIAGMAAAWLLSQAHQVTVYEKAGRVGGHSNTIDVPEVAGAVPTDMGFIVYNEETYPNLTALFRQLGVPTVETEMSFAVSVDNAGLEYGTIGLASLFGQPQNLIRPRFWSMLRDLRRFYREAPEDLTALELDERSLGDYLSDGGYGRAFVEDHILPMAAAIWSTSAEAILDHQAAGFVRFCENHGLLRLTGRPVWRTVRGGSRVYVSRLTAPYADRVRLGSEVRSVHRDVTGVRVRDQSGAEQRHDHVVIATHADQALAMLGDASAAERRLLGAMRYGASHAVMHRDPALMPLRRRTWSSWNYLGAANGQPPSVTYWMNRLQPISTADPIFVTLNPQKPPRADSVIRCEDYTHPLYDQASARAQRELWSLQGERRTWFCGSYFGAGFHEDGLQAGLAVAESLGGLKRPWTVAAESGRIHLSPALADQSRLVA
jgi:predicted NAD/FAD-binding protein